MAEYIEYHPLKFWLNPASIAEIVAHIQKYLVDNPINSTTEIETIIHDYLIAHPELIGGVDSVNGQTGEVILTAENINAGETVTIKDVLDSLQDQINDIVISIPSDYQQLINDVSDLKNDVKLIDDELFNVPPIDLSGSWTKNYAHNYTPSDQVLITVDSSTENRNVAISTIEDMDNPSVATRIFVLSPGQKVLWIPDKNYEGLQISVNGSCVASATIYSGAFSRVPHVFYCGLLRDYKTIKSAVEKATQYMDSVLYVDAGTYNLIDEFGAEYFENLTSTDVMTGISLQNRIHIIFDPKSKVVCNYTGSNQYAQSLFSPFVVGQFGFTLENLTLECSRCRYAVHDERNGGTEYCESNYINCNIKIDNSQNQYFGSNAPTVIGGGLGANHVVNINSCIFDTSMDGAYSAGVYYHQSNKMSDPNHKCFLSIKNNYFRRGLLTFQFERTDTAEDTNIIAEGNSFPQISGQDAQGIWASGMTGTHTNLYAWNNIIRSA